MLHSRDLYDTFSAPGSSFAQSLGIRVDGQRWLVDYESYRLLIRNSHTYYEEVAGDSTYLPYQLTDDGEMVLYDFGMEVGDRYVSVEGHADVSVVKTGTVSLPIERLSEQKVTLKTLLLSNGLILVEGLGCVNSPGLMFHYLNPSPHGIIYDGWRPYLYFYEGPFYWLKISLPQHDAFFASLSAVRPAQAATSTSAAPLFDLSGRRLQGAPQRKGVYISGGKKVVR